MKDFDLADVFLLSHIIDKMGLNIEADKLTKTINAEKLENKDDVAKIGKDVLLAIGIDVAVKFMSSLYKADKEVIQLISNITEKKPEAVRTMKMKEIKQFFVDLVAMEGFKDFFNQAEASEELK